MKTIGVRELRQRASEFLRDVEKGRIVEVTAHGRPVARLVPVGSADRRQQLAASGRLTLARGDLLGLGAPLPPQRGVPAPGVLLARVRDDER
jgi:prevent-host-death family protein